MRARAPRRWSRWGASAVAVGLATLGCVHTPRMTRFPAGSCVGWIEYEWNGGMGIVAPNGCVALGYVDWIRARCIEMDVTEVPRGEATATVSRGTWVLGVSTSKDLCPSAD